MKRLLVIYFWLVLGYSISKDLHMWNTLAFIQCAGLVVAAVAVVMALVWFADFVRSKL